MCGSVAASPTIISEKKTPIDSDVPELKNVARIPEAAPRSWAGTLFMMPVVFGAENRPEPMPFTTSKTANSQYGKFVGNNASPAKLIATTTNPPVANVRLLHDAQTVRVGDLALTAHATPGHAPGSTSWTWVSCEGPRCLRMAYADSLSAASGRTYRFSDHADYIAAFRRSIDTVASLPCDILLTPHPLASDLSARLDGKAPLVDSDACRRYADGARTNLERRLQEEKKPAAP